jgi:Ca-activated chloride channel family protein
MQALRSLAALAIGVGCLTSTLPAHADLPEWLRKHNGDVDDGNDALNKGDAKGALEAYNRAARRLPDAPGLQLDRGIALLKQGDYGKSREALLAATVPNASTDVRADAYHNLALSFYREADGLAGQDQHDEAQKLFREAADAAKRSLHLRPGDANVAWNLELANRRMREEQQKKKEEDEQKKKDQQDKDKQDKGQQDQQNQDQQDQDKQNQDQQNQDQQDQDQNKPGDKQDDKQDDKQKPEDDPSKQDKAGQDKPEEPKPPQDQAQDQAKQDQAKQEQPQDGTPEKTLPREAQQALDSLENNEENFERYRARQRATRERRPEKDW